jgi:hypothetical protein
MAICTQNRTHVDAPLTNSARNLKRIAAAAAVLLLEEPASDPLSHLVSRIASSCDWVNFRVLPMSLRSPEGAEKPRAPLQTMLPKWA